VEARVSSEGAKVRKIRVTKGSQDWIVSEKSRGNHRIGFCREVSRESQDWILSEGDGGRIGTVESGRMR